MLHRIEAVTMTRQIRGYVTGRLRGRGIMLLNANILADTFINHRYIPKEVALNPRASNTWGKVNYNYISEISFARSGKTGLHQPG